MAITSNQLAVTSSASSPPIRSWDVFLSFYGKDTRRNFVAHLYFALDQAGLSTFRDDPALKKGQQISSGLVSAIKDTNMFVVVISENYARSSWCLNELVEIMSCKKTRNQVVPVFYYVDPSHLRHHKGSFGEALDYHKKHNNYCVDIVDKWKSALAEIAELSGYHLKQDANENESDTVQEIVDHLTSQTSTKALDLEEYLVGIDSAVEEIYQKLRMKSTDVHVIGICGMGGIGKTTIAKAFYNRYFTRFDISCCIGNENQYSQGGTPLISLLEQLLSELLRRKNYKVFEVKSGMRQLQHILHSKKALIVMDDLKQTSHLELLARLCKMVSAGSRIVITTRDVNQLNQLKVDISQVDIYMVRKLEIPDSLKLFSYHAFRKTIPPDSFIELSVGFVTYGGGLPLFLKVLGSSLRGNTDVSFWRAKLKKVVKIPENEITKILRLSYEELADETEKEIFLDIVFFFVGKDIDEAVRIFRSCDFFPEVGIQRLIDRCLLTVDSCNKFEMHNLIRDMGKEVIGEESKHGKGRRLNLCDENEYQALENLEKANAIEGIILNISTWQNRQLSAEIFETMPNLRLLEIIGAHHIEGSFVNSFHELRCIHWHYCPWTQLPSTFRPQKLVSIDMPFSKFKILWKDTMPLRSLEIANLSYSKKLKKTPDFRDMKMIEDLRFRGCESLQKVHSSIGHLCYLTDLDLGACYKLKELPDQLGDIKGLKMLDASYTATEKLPDSICELKALRSLNLAQCMKLRKLPEQFGDMECLKHLDASFSGIEELPDSIGRLMNLAHLDLYYCQSLTSLPDSICKLKLLATLDIGSCLKLEILPEQFGDMVGLERFRASGSGIQELPDTIGRLINLAFLHLEHCKSLTSLPESICELNLLQYLDLDYSRLERLPKQLGKLHSLQVLLASHTAIQELPESIWNLTSLVNLRLPQEDIFTSSLPVTVNCMNKLTQLTLRCNLRLWLPMILSFCSLEVLRLCDDVGNSLSWFSLSALSNLRILTLNSCGSSFPEFPLNLTELELYNNDTREELPDLSNLKHLRSLDIKNCINLPSLPPLPLNLISLSVDRCTNLKNVSDLSMLKKLTHMWFIQCINLESVDLKQSHLLVWPPNSKAFSFRAHLPNREIAEWFDYKSSGSTISFTIPSLSILGDEVVGISLWFVYKHPRSPGYIKTVLNNKTDGIKENYTSYVDNHIIVGEELVQSHVECISKSIISMKSGDRFQVSIQKSLFLSPLAREGEEIGGKEVKVDKCGAHVILRKHSAVHDKVSICTFGN